MFGNLTRGARALAACSACFIASGVQVATSVQWTLPGPSFLAYFATAWWVDPWICAVGAMIWDRWSRALRRVGGMVKMSLAGGALVVTLPAASMRTQQLTGSGGLFSEARDFLPQ